MKALRHTAGAPAVAAAVVLVASLFTAGQSAAAATGGAQHFVQVGKAAPVPTSAHLVGLLAASTPIDIDVVLKPRDPADLAREVQAVSDPSSPDYHHFIARGQFASMFGPLPSTITAVRATLGSLGLDPEATASNGLVIPVHTVAARAESALHTRLVSYAVGGRSAFANTAGPSLPASIAGEVQAVTGLDTVDVPHPREVTSRTGGLRGALSPRDAYHRAGVFSPRVSGPSCAGVTADANNVGAYTACQIASAYGFTTAYATGDQGAGETVAIYEEEPYAGSDVQGFEQAYGISTSVTPVNVDGGPGTGFGSGEAALDIDNVVSLAPQASVLVYQGPPGSGADLWNKIVTDDRAPVISTSWGLCESSAGSAEALAEEPIFQQAATQGQTILSAAGDSGAEDCFSAGRNTDASLQVDDPASQPDVTGVGGTALSSVSPVTETVWNNCQGAGASCVTDPANSSYGSGGGGISSNWAMPTWQKGVGVVNVHSSAVPCNGGSTDCREVPDVSASADASEGYLVYHSGSWGDAGGTSAAAPVWAALVALADQACGTSAGMINPTLYSLATSHPSDFNDVTSGNNDLTNTNNGLYPATPGYDMASGLGTPTAALLAPGALCQASNNPPPTTTTTTVPPTSTTTTSTTAPAGTTTTSTTAPPTTTTTVPTTPPSTPGYWMLDNGGNVYSFGSAAEFCPGQAVCRSPGLSSAAAIAPTPDGGGYWVVSPSGAVDTAGDAGTFHLSAQPEPGSQVVTIASTPDGKGYWLATDTGQVIIAGDAGDFGSPQSEGLKLAGFIVNMAPTADGGGYWMLDDTGGVMTFGDASYFGSPGQLNPSAPPGGKNSILPLNKPAVAMASTSDGRGYWFVAADGGIFSFGDAGFYGSTGRLDPALPPGGNNSIVNQLAKPVNGMVVTASGLGYWMVAQDGGVFAFGDAGFVGSLGGSNSPPQPVVGFAPV